MSESIQTLIPEHCKGAPLADRVYFILKGLYTFSPIAFSELEGFTREEGHVVFISRFPHKIRNSGHGFRALPIPDSEWFVNTSVSQPEAVRFFDRICSAMRLPIEVKRYIIYLVTPPLRGSVGTADIKFAPIPSTGIPPLPKTSPNFTLSQLAANRGPMHIQRRIPMHMKLVLGAETADELEIVSGSKGIDVRFLIALHWQLVPQEKLGSIAINKLTSFVDSACFLLQNKRSPDQLKTKIAASLTAQSSPKFAPVSKGGSSTAKKSGHRSSGSSRKIQNSLPKKPALKDFAPQKEPNDDISERDIFAFGKRISGSFGSRQ